MIDILERDGLSVELLLSLSYKSELGISLKKNLHYFDRDLLLAELFKANEWYQGQSALVDLPCIRRPVIRRLAPSCECATRPV